MLDSIDAIIASARTSGAFSRFYLTPGTGSTTAATITSGYISAGRYPRTLTVPAQGGGVTALYLTYARLFSVGELGEVLLLAAAEYELGSLAVATNTFSSGVVMPTKTIKSQSIQTAASLTAAVATAALTATTPDLTISYTNQSGTTSRTATLTLPTGAAVNSAFLVGPHLQSGDTGVRAVTNLSISTGSAGTIKLYGLMILGMGFVTGTAAVDFTFTSLDPLQTGIPLWPLAVGDKISFWKFGTTSSLALGAVLAGVGDT